MAEPPDSFDFVYHNIVFPPKLPERTDEHEVSKQVALVDLVLRSCDDYTVPEGQSESMLRTCLKRSFTWLRESYVSGNIVESRLQYAFRSMDNGGGLFCKMMCSI